MLMLSEVDPIKVLVESVPMLIKCPMGPSQRSTDEPSVEGEVTIDQSQRTASGVFGAEAHRPT
jgi:hypothetical protein